MSYSFRGLNDLLVQLRELKPGAGVPAPIGRAAASKAQISGISDSLLQMLILGLLAETRVAAAQIHRNFVIVLPQQKDLHAWSSFLDGSIHQFGATSSVLPFFSSWGSDRYINPSLSRKQRLYSLARMSERRASHIILTTLHGLAQNTLPPEQFKSAILGVNIGMTVDQDEFCAQLRNIGYLQNPTVEDEGTYAVRGGIIDVYPLNEDLPARIEFLGDSIASIRSFSATDQKSRASLTALSIAPAIEVLIPESHRKDQAQKLFSFLVESEIDSADRDGFMAAFQMGLRPAGFEMLAPLLRAGRNSALEYLNQNDILIFPKTMDSCLDTFRDFFADANLAHEKDAAAHKISLPPDSHFAEPQLLQENVAKSGLVIECGNPYSSPAIPFFRPNGRMVVEGAPMPVKDGGTSNFEKWCDVIVRHLKSDGASVAILATQTEQVERIINLLNHRSIPTTHAPDILQSIVTSKPLGTGVHVGLGAIQSHLLLEDLEILIIPDTAIFGSKLRKTKPASAKLQNYLSSFKDLKPGDLVVHIQHGIGRYTGMTSLDVAGITSDFLIIEYSGNDKIYLPVDRLNLLQRYNSGGEGVGSTLDKLGGPNWDKRKARVKSAVKDMAADLLKIQAKRSLADHHQFSPPPDAYYEFEAAFPYEETEDQIKALADIQSDLAAPKPMDRLICGDVGFGKTEVALRTALRSVLEGFQVLVLVPTTVLCYQHYRTFSDRLSSLGLQVGQINRFVDTQTTKKTLEKLENGKLDVLVGTHRVLSSDVKPKKLGLIVIDEEQRFGVAHKEKLKSLKAGVDVLTLTATPIPRTLHMSMLGLRDISIIATPPQERISVKTYVARFDETLVKDAIEREVKRGGQVFFVHNRVQDIEEMATFVRSLVPGIEVRVGHGQMREHQLEKVIVDFIEQKFPVLVCTTIIESGIDMPHVNTLIVNHAERFGLAQLYQLRGRVGRSSEQAFAYFLTGGEERLTDEAKQRLDVLAAHQELGAGFQIASHDLEIRGAGNLLGGEQSGHAASIGLELYTDMLEEAIAEIRGQTRPEKVDTEIKIPISALIPRTYIENESHRLQFYKSLFAAESDDEISSVRKDVEDRYGSPPPEFLRLLKVARLKRLLRVVGATTLTSSTKGFVELKFGSLSEAQIDKILGVVHRHPDKYRLAPDYRLFMYFKIPSRPTDVEQDQMLTDLIAQFEPVAQEIESLGRS